MKSKLSTTTFYNDDPELPVFSNVISRYPAEQVVRILMDPELDQDKVCHVQPMGVTKNASFIIDVDDVQIKSGCTGMFQNQECPKAQFLLKCLVDSLYIDILSQLSSLRCPASLIWLRRLLVLCQESWY